MLLSLLYCTVLNRFSGNIFSYKYVRLYIGCGNLMVNVDQQHNLQRLTQNKTGNVHYNKSPSVNTTISWDSNIIEYIWLQFMLAHSSTHIPPKLSQRYTCTTRNAKQDWQCTYKCNIVVLLCNNCWRGKAIILCTLCVHSLN